jgi:hypothetical protein
MRHLVDAVRRSVREQNWYAALAGALTLPDIAARLDGRNGGRSRYISWFNDYLGPTYTQPIGPQPGRTHVYLSGDDCYALRCAYLHEGEFDVTSHKVHDALDRFQFLAPNPQGNVRHMVQVDRVLQL